MKEVVEKILNSDMTDENKLNVILHYVDKIEINIILNNIKKITRYSILPDDLIYEYLKYLYNYSHTNAGGINYLVYEYIINDVKKELNECTKNDENKLNMLLNYAKNKEKLYQLFYTIREIPKYANIPDELLLQILDNTYCNSYLKNEKIDYSSLNSMIKIAKNNLDAYSEINKDEITLKKINPK